MFGSWGPREIFPGSSAQKVGIEYFWFVCFPSLADCFAAHTNDDEADQDDVCARTSVDIEAGSSLNHVEIDPHSESGK